MAVTQRVAFKLWLWFWHLLPANPIVVRVVQGASRRPRHLWLRVAYLSALLGVVLISLIAALSGPGGSLADLAKGASQTFKLASITQLGLMCFLAPVFTAAAITQERDAQTFNILLSTPLTNAQIVFGSLMSRLYFVIMLLVAGLPIFLMTMVYGGVTTSQVVESFLLSGSTAILTGALAICVAMAGVGTRRTIFSFYMMIGLYLLTVYLLGRWDRTWIDVSAPNLDGVKMSYLTALHPFLALDVALNRVYAPAYSHLGGYSAPVRYALAYPAAVYVAWTSTLAFLLTVMSVFFVRRGAKLGEATILSSLRDKIWPTRKDRFTRAPRHVWTNPVAWREAKTRAAGQSWLRWAIAGGGIVGAIVLLVQYTGGSLKVDEVRIWIAGLVIVQFAMTLLIATNTAATSMTKEKESHSMDLLLSTPLTSRYILWGKLRGLVSFAMPLLIGPGVALLLFGLVGLSRDDTPPVVAIETFSEVMALTIIYTACACVLGLQVSLKTKKNVTAVMSSVTLVILVSGVASLAGFAFVEASGGNPGAFLAPFTPFTSLWYLINPADLFDSSRDFANDASSARVAAALGSAIACCVGAFIVWSFYASLVRGFDMIMRKQSGT